MRPRGVKVRLLAVLLMILAISVAVHAMYGRAHTHQRLPEDRLVVWSNHAVTGESVSGALMGHFHDSTREGWRGSIRPLSTVALRTHHSWFHQSRSGYQRMQMVWMIVACTLIMAMFHGERRSLWQAAAGGLLFAAHPLATGSVLNLAGIGELLALSFLAAAFLILQPLSAKRKGSQLGGMAGWRSGPVWRLRIVASGVCFLLAFWSHELAVAGLPLLGVWVWAMARGGKPGHQARGPAAPFDEARSRASVHDQAVTPASGMAVLSAWGAFLVFIVHRFIAHATLPEHLKMGHAVLTTTGIAWSERVWLGLQSGPTVLGLVFFPARLGYVHDHLIAAGPGTAGAAVGLLLLAGVAALMVRGILKGSAGLAFWSGWAFFFLLGAMGFVVNPGDVSPVRLVFMSLPGFIGLALIGADSVVKRLGKPAVRWALLVTGLAACLLLGFRTHSRVGEFDGEERLILAQLRDYPKSARAHFDRGNLFLTRGQWTAAQAEYETALALRPDFSMAWANLGNAYFSQEEYGLAMRAFLFALAETNGRPEFAVVEARAEYHRALILMQQNRNEEAVVAFGRMIEIFPDHLPSHANLGFIYSNAPAFEAQARYHLNRALSLEADPGRRQTLEHYLELIDERRGRIGEESELPPSALDDWEEWGR